MVETVQRKVLSVREAAVALGIGASTLRRLIKDGKLRSVRIFDRVVVPIWSIDEFLNKDKVSER